MAIPLFGLYCVIGSSLIPDIVFFEKPKIQPLAALKWIFVFSMAMFLVLGII